MALGYEIPVHRSLTTPLMLGGVPREVAVVNGTFAAAFVFGFGTLWLLPLSLIVHLGFVSACRHDPEIAEVLVRHFRQKDVLEV